MAKTGLRRPHEALRPALCGAWQQLLDAHEVLDAELHGDLRAVALNVALVAVRVGGYKALRSVAERQQQVVGIALQGEAARHAARQVCPDLAAALVDLAAGGDGVQAPCHAVAIVVLGLARHPLDGHERGTIRCRQAEDDGTVETRRQSFYVRRELVDDVGDVVVVGLFEGDGGDRHHVEDEFFAVVHIVMYLYVLKIRRAGGESKGSHRLTQRNTDYPIDTDGLLYRHGLYGL